MPVVPAAALVAVAAAAAVAVGAAVAAAPVVVGDWAHARCDEVLAALLARALRLLVGRRGGGLQSACGSGRQSAGGGESSARRGHASSRTVLQATHLRGVLLGHGNRLHLGLGQVLGDYILVDAAQNLTLQSSSAGRETGENGSAPHGRPRSGWVPRCPTRQGRCTGQQTPSRAGQGAHLVCGLLDFAGARVLKWVALAEPHEALWALLHAGRQHKRAGLHDGNASEGELRYSNDPARRERHGGQRP